MPYVVVRMLKGEAIEKKRVLVKEVAEAVAKALELPTQNVAVELEEFTPENMGRGAVSD